MTTQRHNQPLATPWVGYPILPFLAIGVAVAAYLPHILRLEYVWDDWHLFLANPGLRMPEHVWSTALKPILPDTTYFRPLPLLGLALEFQLFGIDPAVSHGINLALHAVNTLLVGLIAGRLTAADLAAHARARRVTLAMLFYGLHPAMIEPVSWTAGRFDLMVTVFMLSGIWGYLVLKAWSRIIWVTLCFFLAALSKEMAVTLPLILAVLYLAREGQGKHLGQLWHRFWQSGEWRLHAGLIVAGMVYLALKAFSLGALAHEDRNLVALLEGPAHHLAFIGQTLLFYVKMSVFPFADLNPQHPYNVAEMDLTARLGGWLGLLLALASAVVALHRRTPGMLLGLSYLISLLPVLNIVPLTIGGNIGHERFLTFPLSLFALALVSLRLEWRSSRAMQRALPFLLGLLATLWLAVALVNIRVTVPLWGSDLRLWSWAYAKYPDSPYVKAMYLTTLIHEGDYADAQRFIAQLDKENDSLRALKGFVLIRTGHPEEGTKILQDLMAKLPKPPSASVRSKDVHGTRTTGLLLDYASLLSGTAEGLLEMHKFEAALETARDMISSYPLFPPGYLWGALAYYGLDRWEEGQRHYRRALQLYITPAAREAHALRDAWLSKLCSAPRKPRKTCQAWAAEQGSKQEIGQAVLARPRDR